MEIIHCRRSLLDDGTAKKVGAGVGVTATLVMGDKSVWGGWGYSFDIPIGPYKVSILSTYILYVSYSQEGLVSN